MSETQNSRVTQADEEWAEEVASAANIVTNGGYYEIDIDAVTLVIARHREAAEAASKAREAALVEALAMFVECARYQPHMGGHHRFMGWNQSDLRRAESHARATLAALTKEPDV